MVVAECEILDEPDEEDSVEVLWMSVMCMAPLYQNFHLPMCSESQ